MQKKRYKLNIHIKIGFTKYTLLTNIYQKWKLCLRFDQWINLVKLNQLEVSNAIEDSQ